MNSPMDRLHSKFRKRVLYGAQTRREVYRCADRGRDVGTIACYLNIPCSVISKILAERPAGMR